MSLLHRALQVAIIHACLTTLEPAAAQAQAPVPAQAPAPPAQATPSESAGTPVDFGDVGATQVQPSAAQPGPQPLAPAPAPASAAPLGPAPSAPFVEAPARDRYNAVNLSVLGFVLGRVRLNYERMLTRNHGVFVEALVSPNVLGGFDFVGYGGALGYRWHWRGPGDSGFVGAVLAIETADGTIDVRTIKDDKSYRYQGRATSLTIAPHIGKRWLFRNGLNLTVRVGFGYAPTLSTKPGPRAEAKAIDIMKDRVVGADGEASIGYSF